MHGFRFSQKALLEKFLLADCSGCLKAPTRYGKSTLIVNTMRAYPGITTVFTCPGEDLLRQSVKDFKAAMPERDIRMLGAGSSNRISGPDITICSMDSLHLCDHGKVRLLIPDEPHALMTDGRIPQLNKFQFARRLSFGATLEGRFDGRDLVLEGLLGPVLAERTYEEAVKEGAICPLVILLLKVNLHRKAVTGKRDQVYKHTIFESPEIASMMANICRLMPDDWQHLVFIRQEVQADLIQEALGDDTPIAMAKVLKKKVRAQMAQDMRFNNLRRCISSDIFATGVTFHDIRCVVNASGGRVADHPPRNNSLRLVPRSTNHLSRRDSKNSIRSRADAFMAAHPEITYAPITVKNLIQEGLTEEQIVARHAKPAARKRKPKSKDPKPET